MSYVKHILLPGEHVLYDGHVHPTVLLSGTIRLGIAALLLLEASHTGDRHSILLAFAYHLSQFVHWTRGFYQVLVDWQIRTPDIAIEVKIVALAIALWGFARFANGLVLMQTTELVITDRRIIAKTGILTINTIEMDRNRVSGVIIEQSLRGRIMGFGYIHIQGFTSSIGGLPPMVNPHLIEKFVQ